MRTALRPSCDALLLELARSRNVELARENERLRSALDDSRRLLDEALALAAQNHAVVAAAAPSVVGARRPQADDAAPSARRIASASSARRATAAVSRASAPPARLTRARRFRVGGRACAAGLATRGVMGFMGFGKKVVEGAKELAGVGGMAGANAATAPCCVPRAGGRSADGWLLTPTQVVQHFKAAGKSIGWDYVRSCMRHYLKGGDPGYTRDAERVLLLLVVRRYATASRT